VSRRGAARARARARAAERAREAGAVHSDVGAARPREEAVMSDQTGTLEQVDAARAAGSPLSDADLFLFNEGTHLAIYDRLGAQVSGDPARPGVHFAVWAPNAARVSVIGEFNQWDAMAHPLHRRGASGVWAGFVPEARRGELYKYRIQSLFSAEVLEKADPVGLRQELPPATASQVWSLDGHRWRDAAWMAGRAAGQAKDQPISVYEVHLGSWMRIAEEGGRWLTYRELAPRLAAYVKEMGFTHVEFMPLAEHPFYGSWGYQGTGYFAATARFGAPEELMFLIDELHCAGIGVILDWVPAHFPNDAHGLARFDGTHLYEHEDPRRRGAPGLEHADL
jgi:1,4-alpha-glucan branching enzyme